MPRRSSSSGKKSRGGGLSAQLLLPLLFALLVFSGGVFIGSQFLHFHEQPLQPESSSLMGGVDTSGGLRRSVQTDIENARKTIREQEEYLAQIAHTQQAAPAEPSTIPNNVEPVNSQQALALRGNPKTVQPDKVIVGNSPQAVQSPNELLGWGVNFNGDLVLRTATNMDSDTVSIAAWIYLSSSDQTRNMKTIVANKESGCTTDAAHYGFSFYVNQWDTEDRTLVLEVGGAGNGCVKVVSSPGSIRYDQWTHVAFSLVASPSSTSSSASLFVNGQAVRRSELMRFGQTREMLIGQHPLGGWGFVGRMRNVLVLHAAVQPDQLALLMSYGGDGKGKPAALAGAFAFYPLRADQPYTTHLPPAAALEETQAGLSSLIPGAFAPAPVPTPAPAHAPAPAAAAAAATAPAPDPSTPTTSSSRPAAGSAAAAAATTAADLSWTLVESDRYGGKDLGLPPVAQEASVGSLTGLALGAVTLGEVSQQIREISDLRARDRRSEVKKAMQHAWSGYEARAFGRDELMPVSGRAQDNWGGMGTTLVDSLDTLYLMGMHEEFARARDWVASKLTYAKAGSVSVFETTIRSLGGLLGAHSLSGDAVFIQKAVELADKLLPAFNTATGIPNGQLNMKTGSSSNTAWTGGAAVLAELGTLQMELRYLSKHSGDPKYEAKGMKVYEALKPHAPPDGLWPIYIKTATGAFSSKNIALGALGDSFYEYLLKVYILGRGGPSGPDAFLHRWYEQSMDGILAKLVQRSTPSGLAYTADFNGRTLNRKMDHLVCFLPGLLALGTLHSNDKGRNERDLLLARALMYTCWQMYERQPTGIAPEFVTFVAGSDMKVGANAPYYILRPEASESLFILNKITGDPIYREWGWSIFSAINKHCYTQYGYGHLPDVRVTNRKPDDRMESFFLAETMKYLYLLQDPDTVIDLNQYVFNTEAHPLKI